MPEHRWTSNACSSPLLHHGAHIVRVDEIGCRPAVQIVFGHASFCETLVTLRGSSQIGDQERLKTDAFVITEIVPLVKLVTPAKLRADGIPHQLHQLDPVFGTVAVGATDELIEEWPNLWHLE